MFKIASKLSNSSFIRDILQARKRVQNAIVTTTALIDNQRDQIGQFGEELDDKFCYESNPNEAIDLAAMVVTLLA